MIIRFSMPTSSGRPHWCFLGGCLLHWVLHPRSAGFLSLFILVLLLFCRLCFADLYRIFQKLHILLLFDIKFPSFLFAFTWRSFQYACKFFRFVGWRAWCFDWLSDLPVSLIKMIEASCYILNPVFYWYIGWGFSVVVLFFLFFSFGKRISLCFWFFWFNFRLFGRGLFFLRNRLSGSFVVNYLRVFWCFLSALKLNIAFALRGFFCSFHNRFKFILYLCRSVNKRVGIIIFIVAWLSFFRPDWSWLDDSLTNWIVIGIQG